jgi:hypothetical protein
MARKMIDTAVLSDPGWWHWAVTAVLLAAHLLHVPWALWGAWWVCVGMTAAYWYELRSVRAMPVQVRLAYLVLLAVGSLPGMRWVHVVQLAGTVAMATVGYCPLPRALSLLWFNRTGPLTPGLVRRAMFGRPNGGLLRLGGAPVPVPVRADEGRRPGDPKRA